MVILDFQNGNHDFACPAVSLFPISIKSWFWCLDINRGVKELPLQYDVWRPSWIFKMATINILVSNYNSPKKGDFLNKVLHNLYGYIMLNEIV